MSKEELEDFEREILGENLNVKIPSIELIKIDDIKSDGKNPNRLSDSKRDALRKNMLRYGFIVPVITNKDLILADGEHRVEIAKDLGMSEVPVLRLDVNEVDRRILRQTLNKLRGEHDFNADLEEFKYLYNEPDGLFTLSEMLGEEEKYFENLLKETDDTDFESKNKEIDIESFGKEFDIECPKCGFKWEKR